MTQGQQSGWGRRFAAFLAVLVLFLQPLALTPPSARLAALRQLDVLTGALCALQPATPDGRAKAPTGPGSVDCCQAGCPMFGGPLPVAAAPRSPPDRPVLAAAPTSPSPAPALPAGWSPSLARAPPATA